MTHILAFCLGAIAGMLYVYLIYRHFERGRRK